MFWAMLESVSTTTVYKGSSTLAIVIPKSLFYGQSNQNSNTDEKGISSGQPPEKDKY